MKVRRNSSPLLLNTIVATMLLAPLKEEHNWKDLFSGGRFSWNSFTTTVPKSKMSPFVITFILSYDDGANGVDLRNLH